jgi:hypothetical protein
MLRMRVVTSIRNALTAAIVGFDLRVEGVPDPHRCV